MIKPWKLSKIYKDHGIKRKRVIRKEVSGRKTPLKANETEQSVKAAVEKAIAEKRKIIFVDEVLFTRSSCMSVEYSCKGQNITLLVKGSHGGYMAAVAGISYQEGLEFVMT